jgi:hypothetical protein
VGFLEVAGQLVREDCITRLSHNPAAGVPAVQFFVHVVDGGIITVSEPEYHRLKKRLEPTNSRKKSA